MESLKNLLHVKLDFEQRQRVAKISEELENLDCYDIAHMLVALQSFNEATEQ